MPVRVDRSDIPLLVIGVGGTGKDIALSIKRKFIDRFNGLDATTMLPKKTAFLVFDGDSENIGADPRGLTGNEHCDITFANLPNIFKNKSFTEEEQAWINPNLTPIAIMNGAGGIRQVGRIQLFRNMTNVITKMGDALQQILGANADTPPDQFSANILVCGSLSGGTGSGASLDIAYIVRQLIHSRFNAYETNLKLYGMFLMPECIIQHAKKDLSDTRHRELRANAFAAMKEIDYWMRQEVHGDVLTVRYPGLQAEWNCRPFNYLGYLGHTWENGLPINNPYQVAVEKVAEFFLLLSTETPQVQNGELTPHTIYSSLSNAGNEMLVHSDDAPYPVSAWAMSLGTSEYSSFENEIQNYEIQKTLHQVLEVKLFNPNSGEIITEEEARVNSIDPVTGILGMEEAQDNFFTNLTMDIEAEDDFRTKTGYPFTADMWTRESIEAAGRSYVSDIRNFYTGQQSSANEYYEKRFRSIWQRFGEEAKKAITNIQCGPVAFLKFLNEVYIPDVETALEEARAISAEGGEGRAQADVFASQGEDTYAYIVRILHPGANPRRIFEATLRWDDYANTYESNMTALSSCEWNWRCMGGKAIAVSGYLDKLKNYRDNLTMVIETIQKQEESLAANTDSVQDESSLLTFDQLRKYLEGVNLPDAGIAKARDQVLRQVADLSFDLPNVNLAQSYEEREKLFKSFRYKVKTFVNTCFEDQELTSMDRVLNAAVSGTSETEQNYMANVIAPNMVRAAQPMLHLETAARAIPEGFYEYHHVAIPENAPLMLAGYNQFITGKGDNGTQKSDYSKNTMVDRMLMLNLKVCIPMYLMADTAKLMMAYEEQLDRPTNASSQGIHLVGTNQINALSDTTNTLEKCWRRLPCPIPPVEIAATDMSPMQKENMAYLEKRFGEAVENGIITFAGEGGVAPYEPGNPNGTYVQETFEIHGFTLGNDKKDVINTMMIDDIKEAIDKIRKDENLKLETRLSKLQQMRSGSPIRSIHYGKYMSHYATALQRSPIKPMATDDKDVRTACAGRYKEVRHKLCAYMLGTYPRCLDLIEKEFKVFEYLHEAERILQDEIDKQAELARTIKEFCMLFAGDIIIRRANWFGLDYNGTFNQLFQNKDSIISMETAAAYPEYAFVMQWGENQSVVKETLIDQINEEKENRPADALAIINKNMAETIQPQLESKVKEWEAKLAAIKGMMDISRIQKEKMLMVYTNLLDTANNVLTALKYA